VPSVQIKNVPSDVHAVMRRRAAAAGQSLQEYLLGRMVDEASRPTVEEVLDRAGGRAGGSIPLAEAAALLRSERDAQ
jgi:antitoxin FitA